MGKGVLDFFKENPEVAGSIASIVPTVMGLHQQAKAKNAIYGEGGYMQKLESIERGREQLVNPFETIENPYKNLSVATKAAEMQAEQTDIALANTLDTLRETGKGAGGATAIAQAALKSKQNVAASIEKQEAQNEKLKAQGQLQVDIAKGKGEMFRVQQQGARDTVDLNRTQELINLEQQRRAAGSSTAALGGAGVLGGLVGLIKPEVKEDGTSADTDAAGVAGADGTSGNRSSSIEDVARGVDPFGASYIGDPTAQVQAGGTDLASVMGGRRADYNLNNNNISTARKTPKVPGATNLSNFYGGNLPSIEERRNIFIDSGLGDVYGGTADQNNILLEYLQYN